MQKHKHKTNYKLILSMMLFGILTMKPAQAHQDNHDFWTHDILGLESFEQGQYVTGTLVGAADVATLGFITLSGVVLVSVANSPSQGGGYGELAIVTPLLWAGLSYFSGRVIALTGDQYEFPKADLSEPRLTWRF